MIRHQQPPIGDQAPTLRDRLAAVLADHLTWPSKTLLDDLVDAATPRPVCGPHPQPGPGVEVGRCMRCGAPAALTDTEDT